MKIVISSIEEKLSEESCNDHRSELIEYIESLVRFCKIGESSQLLINELATKTSSNVMSKEVRDIIDTLRHAFILFACGGLHLLYTRQENECWYPKILLTEVLEPNDIECLDESVKLFRGCDISEYVTGRYGQAWSTSKERADDFAFNHYSSQLWFDSNKRVTLETIYPRDKILFSDQSIEFEIVINPEHVTDVKKHT